MPVEDDVTRVRPVEARDDVERGRLPRPVRPDQADDLAGVDVQGEAVEREDSAEPAVDVSELEERHGAVP